jgi:hypothetical protein
MRQHLDVDPPVRAVREGDAEFAVELGLVLRIDVGQRAHDVAETRDKRPDLLFVSLPP